MLLSVGTCALVFLYKTHHDWKKHNQSQMGKEKSALLRFIEVSHDHHSSERNLRNCAEKPEKVRTLTGFEPVTSRYRCDAVTN